MSVVLMKIERRAALVYLYVHRVLEKKQSELFFPQLCQMLTKFDNFWQKDGHDDESCNVYSFSILPNLCQRTTV